MEAPDTVALSVSRYQVSAREALPMSANAQITEQHGRGPEHYAAELGGGSVFEIYPAHGRQASTLRLGLSIDGASARPPLEPGRRVLADPDGRKVDLQVSSRKRCAGL
jgi:hypothetical protein